MRHMPLILTLVLMVFLTSIEAGSRITDPYEILNNHYRAIGGMDRLKALKTVYKEGTISIDGTGLEGTLKSWTELPNKSRQEVDLTVLKQVSGDNGEFAWSVDSNRKIQINRDEKTLEKRRIGMLAAEYDFLNPDSKNFTVTFEGIKKVENTDCYAVKIANSINDDITISYYDTASFMQVGADVMEPDAQVISIYSDFRDVDGIIMAFKEVSTFQPTGMIQRVEFTRTETNNPIDPSIFEPPDQDVKDFTFANGKSAENIPFQFIEHHIYLEVSINGKIRLWVLDSGASVSLIDRKFAEELGLEVKGEVKGRGTDKLIDVSYATLPAFSLPGLQFEEQTVAAIDISWLFYRILGVEVVGILGYDFLSRLVTRIDYANELISFYHPDSFSYSGEATIIDAPLAQNNMFHVPFTVDGKYGGKWNLDLGAGGSSFHYPFAEEHNLLNRDGVDRKSFGAGGAAISRNLKFDTMEFAGFTLHNPVISIPTTEGKGAFSGKELTGNLGNRLFRHFVMYLDYKSELVIVEKGDDFGRDFPMDKSGLQFEYVDDSTIRIDYVADNTPGRKAGFQEGDVVQSVNGIGINYFGGIIALRKLLRGEPGTKYAFDVLRNGRSRTLKLTLKDLYH
ncbi:MAG: aspartyl protease family protein [Candidatus Zixiibacteriota bacterium]|nr:MAG: aspartyl protease family protein [candidate division Zixibacteria bacterium]